MNFQLQEYLRLPNEVLSREVLPILPLPNLMEFCVSSPRINQLCQNSDLWVARTNLEFPVASRNKPVNISWVDYYLLLSGNKLIPVYLGDNQIDSIMFVPSFIELTMRRLLPNLANMNIQQPYYVMFADNDNRPYILIRQPNNTVTVISNNYKNVEKVIISQS